VASQLLLIKDDDRGLNVKRLLSLWTECSSSVPSKGNKTAEQLVGLNFKVDVTV